MTRQTGAYHPPVCLYAARGAEADLDPDEHDTITPPASSQPTLWSSRSTVEHGGDSAQSRIRCSIAWPPLPVAWKDEHFEPGAARARRRAASTPLASCCPNLDA
jgi:hypothetical protein